MPMAQWRKKYPCTHCGSGYGECLTGWVSNLMCCKDCEHPGRWVNEYPYTDEEMIEMQAEARGESSG